MTDKPDTMPPDTTADPVARFEYVLSEYMQGNLSRDDVDAARSAVYARQHAEERCAALVEALNRIVELDPSVDSEDGYNEWGEADCFRKAQEIARTAIPASPSRSAVGDATADAEQCESSRPNDPRPDFGCKRELCTFLGQCAATSRAAHKEKQ